MQLVDLEIDYDKIIDKTEENKKTFSAVEKKSGSAGKNLDLVKNTQVANVINGMDANITTQESLPGKVGRMYC